MRLCLVSCPNLTSLLFGAALCHHDLPTGLAACVQLWFPSSTLDWITTSYLCLWDAPRSCASFTNPASPSGSWWKSNWQAKGRGLAGGVGFLYWSRKLPEQLLAVSENRGICTKVGLATPLGTLVVTYWGFSVLLTPWAAAQQLGSLDRWSAIAVLIILNEIAPKRQHSSCCPLQGDSPHKEHGGQVNVQVTKAPGWPLHSLGVAGKMCSTQGTMHHLPLASLLSLQC